MTKTEDKYPAGYTTIDNRVNAMNPVFRGHGHALAIFVDLMLRRAKAPTTKKLHKTNKKSVPIKRGQTLTSYRTLMEVHGFTKHYVEKELPWLEEKGMIARQKCQDLDGFSKNDGQIITILRGFECGQSDTSPDKIKVSSSKRKPFEPPTRDMVLDYMTGKGWDDPSGLAEEFYEYYDATGWIKKNDEPVLSWKGTAIDWKKRRDKRRNNQPATMGSSGNSVFKKATDGSVMRYEGFGKSGIESLVKLDKEAGTPAA